MLIILWISSIFIDERWEKFSLSLRISLTFLVNAYTYVYPSFLSEWFEKLLFLLWNFNLLSFSLDSFKKIEEEEGKFENLMDFDGVVFLDVLLVVLILTIFLNWVKTLWQNMILLHHIIQVRMIVVPLLLSPLLPSYIVVPNREITKNNIFPIHLAISPSIKVNNISENINIDEPRDRSMI